MQTSIDRVSLLSPAEREQVLDLWNATDAAYPAERCIHQLFEMQVEKTPDAVAVICEDRQLTYHELNAQANQLACSLRDLRIGADSRVALCLERSSEMIVSLLAVLKAGAAYVPLDPSYPVKRLQYMLEDSTPAAVLSHGRIPGATRAMLGASDVTVIDVCALQTYQAEASERNLELTELTPNHLAYIIYTSGSTGAPKGVMIEHRSLCNLAIVQAQRLGVDNASRVLQFAPFNFDASVLEWLALCHGASLHIPSSTMLLAGDALMKCISKWRITHALLPPAVLSTLPLDAELPSLRTLIVGGDVSTAGLVSHWASNRRVINAYGPTETTVFVTLYECDAQHHGKIPVGRQISNTRIYILDDHLQPLPIGVVGELYIGGAAVARGYWNRPELTVERFIASPFVAGDRLYKTGDLARYLSDGNIEFLGRNDLQVKIRGFRIELGEIETRLAQHPAVSDVVVLARADEPGEKRLVAYYTRADGADVSNDALRDHLQATLPDYMVPAAYVVLEAFPLMPNGKLDRKALPAPQDDACAARTYAPPVGEIECAIALLWRELLRVERVGRSDNFFELGGHSLLAARMLSHLRAKLGVEVTMREFFANPMLSALAQLVMVATRKAVTMIGTVDRNDNIPLSFAQQRMWFLAQIDGASHAYHIPLGFRLSGELDRMALSRALDQLVARHEALRTTFTLIDGEPIQRIAPADSGFLLVQHDLRGLASAESEVKALIEEEACTCFDLSTGPLIRGRLVTIDKTEHVLLLTLHHVVSDGWSIDVLMRELNALYTIYRDGLTAPLNPLPVQYPDYAAWQRVSLAGEALHEERAYWEHTLEGAPVLLELPTDRPRPPKQDYRGERIVFELDSDLTGKVNALSARYGTTVFVTLLAAWSALLYRLSGQVDVILGVPVFNRARPELEGLIGLFVDTLPIRVNLSDSPTSSQLLSRIKAQALAAQDHQDLPFEQIVDIVRPPRSLAHGPLFQVMFVWNERREAFVLSGLTVVPVFVPHQVAKFDLTLTLTEIGDQIVGTFEYATALFDRSTVERYAGYLRTLVAAMVADPTETIDRIPLLAAPEREKAVVQWNATEAAYPSDACVHQLFETQAEKTPDAVAVIYEERQLSYAELNSQANRLAHELRGMGVRPDTRVALCVERSLEMLVGLLGVLKAGGAYVPIDPSYPTERLSYILTDSDPVAVITHAAGKAPVSALLLQAGLSVVDLQVDVARSSQVSAENPPRGQVTSQHLAYVIYTSGSTGQPKGVMVEHRGVCNYLHWAAKAYSPDHGSVVSSSLSFDATVTSLLTPLVHGSSVRLLREKEELPGVEAYVRETSGGLIKLTPAHFRALGQSLLEEGCVSSASLFVVGGEILPAPSIALWHQTQPNVRIFNEYGPTETVVGCTVHEVTEATSALASIPIGRPIANTRIYILDEYGEPVPLGVTGEIYIGGAGVARGYLNRPELTAERFIPSPFVAGDRLYKTGDLARYLPDGNIEFIGRTDFQAKIRGFRIELGEIEAHLTRHEAIRDAIVLAREDVPGETFLAAYYVLAEGAAVSSEALRAYLSSTLPEYMIPAAYVHLQSLPLTTNGKLDRKALARPDGFAYVTRAYEAPLSEVECVTADIWSAVLGLAKIGRNDNFFELGGHSLLVVRILSRLRDALGAEVAVSDLFAHPVLSDFAYVVGTAKRNMLPRIKAIDRNEPLPLSFSQQRLWFLSQMEGGSRAYHIPIALRMSGDLDHWALRRSLDRLVARHEVLRTTFTVIDGDPVQRIAPADTGFLLIEHDLQDNPHREQLLHELSELEAWSPFDLSVGPLCRGRLIRVNAEEHVLLLTMHHIVSDGWSQGLMLRELCALYDAYREGHDDPLPALSVQYADYAIWQRRWLAGETLQAQASYWQQRLLGAPEALELPTDFQRPAEQDFSGSYVEFELDAELVTRLKALSRGGGATLFMTLLAAWGALMSRLTGQSNVVIGTPVANRKQAETEGLIGCFVNMLALRLDLSQRLTASELLELVRTTTLEAQEHQDIPFEQVVELVNPPRSIAHPPVFQVMFTWQEEQIGTVLPGLTVTRLSTPYVVAKFDLSLSLTGSGDRIVGALEYATALFERSTVERYVEYFCTLLHAMVGDAGRFIDQISLLSADERKQVVELWNATEVPYPVNECIHELFEAQVRQRPNTVAVIKDGVQMTYEELNVRANQLAHYLVDLGVQPEARVALYADRGLEMLVAILAVLKAGAAYVPLDPSYPIERLAFILKDSVPDVMLTHVQASNEKLVNLSSLHNKVTIGIASAVWNLEGKKRNNPRPVDLTPASLAYIMYTSGSSGLPKGVQIEHRSVCNQIRALIERDNLCPGDRILQMASFSYDGSVEQIFGGLLSGATLVLSTDAWLSGADEFWNQCASHQISFMDLTTKFWEQMTEDPMIEIPPAVRQIDISGEAASARALSSWFKRRQRPILMNDYGPTETTVNAASHVLGPEDRSWQLIGRPMANTRIYILDSYMQPVAIGVAGEIYIGGKQVAREYLNRPELTAERFIPSPFVAGDRLYKTGDLARYMSDGCIEFIGRNDFQVKIRGFRVELGEIEARLAEHEAIREAVIIAREDVPGEKRLAAYYVLADKTDVSTEQLRAHLSSILPDYMVPSAYVQLLLFPLTPNGKVDRKAMPAPDTSAYVSRAYVAPVGQVESAIAQIWRELLNLERVGSNDNFFHLGGHSLLAVRAAALIRQVLSADVGIRDIFIHPVLRELATFITNETHESNEPLDLDAEVALDERIRASGPYAAPKNPCILLTGATGFLGSFLLAALMKETPYTVYCLVRSSSVDEAIDKIKRSLDLYELSEWYDASRVFAVVGDISLPNLGCSTTSFDSLAITIDIIYHNAAEVSGLKTYRTLKPVNVYGTQEVLRLACTSKIKQVHYISTMSVVPQWSADVAVPDDAKLRKWKNLQGGYAQSKWVAERLVLLGSTRGISARIYRPTFISGSSITGASNSEDLLSRFIDACFYLECVPDIDYVLNMLPVDYVSSSILKLSLDQCVNQQTYDITHDTGVNLSLITDVMLAAYGSSLYRVPYDIWISKCLAHESTKLFGTLLSPLSMTSAAANGSVQPRVRRQSTEPLDGCLARPAITAELLKKYVAWRHSQLGYVSLVKL